MGKSKQAKEKKFDRNVEISAPILDPEIIRAIHTPPKGQRIDIKHGGFKALLSDLNSQDSTDELAPLDDNHVPSYIGISCAVSGYSNYSPYNKHRPTSHELTVTKGKTRQLNSSSRTTSPLFEHHHEVHHIKIDKNNIHSVDEERKELTEKLTASATERRRSPSPCIPPTEDDRHHGAYVGARYCPLPPPSKLINKHIPLLGIDDELDPDEFVEEDTNKVEHKIASLYGEDFVDDWRESMTHKAKNVTSDQENQNQEKVPNKSPKDLVTLKPAPHVGRVVEEQKVVEVPTPNVKVLAGVEKQFLNKLLTDENPPMPSPSPEFHHPAPPEPDTTIVTNSSEKFHSSPQRQPEPQQLAPQKYPSPPVSPSPPSHDEQEQRQPMSPDSGKSQSFADEELVMNASHDNREEHIKYEIRSQSPIDNQSSPVKIRATGEESESKLEDSLQPLADQKLVTFSPEPAQVLDQVPEEEEETSVGDTQLPQVDEGEEEEEVETAAPTSSDSHDGRYYLGLLEQEKSFILDEVRKAEKLLEGENSTTENFDEDTVGRIRSAIGKANLLVNKKFNQFKELCEANISSQNSSKQFATLNDDLAGFWDMLSIQVNDIRRSFETVRLEKESTWRGGQETEEERQSHEVTETTSGQAGASEEDGSEGVLASSSSKVTTNAAGSSKPKLSAQKDQERRERLQEHINQMKQSQAAKVSSENLLDDMNSDFTVELVGQQQQEEEKHEDEQAGASAKTPPSPPPAVGDGSQAKEQKDDNGAEEEAKEQEEQLFSLMGLSEELEPVKSDGELS